MKTWKNLLIPGIVLVVLIAGLIIYNAAFKDKLNPSEPTSTTNAQTQYLVNYTADMISGIHVLSSDGTGYLLSSAVPAADGTMTWAFASDTEDYSKYALSQPNLATFVSIMSSFNIVEEITTGTDTFSEYGLDHPAYTIEFSLVSGEKHTLLLGNPTYDDANVYCTMDDSGVVYTVNKIKATKCGSTILDFLDMEVMSVLDTDVASVSMTRAEDEIGVTVEGKMLPTADGSSSEFGWQFVSPFSIKASPVFGNLIDSVLELSVTSFVELNPTDISKYGLDDPEYVFDVLLNSGEQIQIILSRDMGGIFYGASTTSPGVFTLASSVITSLQAPLLELIYPYLAYNYLSNIKHIDAVFPEGTFFMDMAVAEGETSISEKSAVSLNGQNAKVVADASLKNRSYFSLLFESVSVINISEFDFGATPLNTKDISIVITLNNTQQTTVDLAVRDENTYYAFIDGEYHGFVVDKGELYRDNGTKLEDYGVWPAYLLLTNAIRDEIGGVYMLSDS